MMVIDWLGCAHFAMTFITNREKMSVDQRNAIAKRKYLNMKLKNFVSTNSKEGKKLISEYRGLHFIEEELKEYFKFYEINIQLYVEKNGGIYGLGEYYDYGFEKTIHLKLCYTTKDGYCHVAFVVNPEKLTHCMACPKCHVYQQDISVKEKAFKIRDHI
jgi:hypothetical protein